VAAARAACAEIAATEPPPLHWDHIGARVYWVTSSERRAATRRLVPRRRLQIALSAGALVAVVAAGLALPRWLGGGEQPSATAPAPAPPVERVFAPAPAPAAARPLHGAVVFAQGEVERGGTPLDLDAVVVAGDRLTTGEDASVVLQFGSDSGMRLGPRSSVELRRFDSRRVEVVLTGSLTVDLTRTGRAAGGAEPALGGDFSFAVGVGEREVVVKGTVFRVDYRDGELEVACARGAVAVRDGVGEVEVAAGQRLQLPAGGLAAAARARAIPADEAIGLARATALPLLPAWPEAEALFATSAVLELDGGGGPVEVDGVERGQGAFLLRVMSGRHRVESGRRGEWVEAAAGRRIEVTPPAAEPARGAAVRRAQIADRLDRGRARQCLRPLEKQGLVEGSYLVLDVGVTASGSISHLNIVKSNLPAEAARCLRDRIDEIALPAGPAATVSYRLAF
jgi:ferric-dicitrate binding protein FerR (iron transport regulator)